MVNYTGEKREVELTDELIIVRRLNITTLSDPLVKVENYSSWKKLLRVTAYVFRFINKVRKRKIGDTQDYFNNLSKIEIELIG